MTAARERPFDQFYMHHYLYSIQLRYPTPGKPADAQGQDLVAQGPVMGFLNFMEREESRTKWHFSRPAIWLARIEDATTDRRYFIPVEFLPTHRANGRLPREC